MRASNEAAKKAANGTHTAIHIGNLQFDEGSNETSRLDLMAKGLSRIGFGALKTDPELKGGRSSSLQGVVFWAVTTKKETGFVLLVSPTTRPAKSRLLSRPGMRSSKNHV